MALLEDMKRKLAKDGPKSFLLSGPDYARRKFRSRLDQVIETVILLPKSTQSRLFHRGSTKDIFNNYQPDTVAEIGVGRGESLQIFLDVCQSKGGERLRYVGFDTFDEGLPDVEEDDHAKYGVWDLGNQDFQQTGIEVIRDLIRNHSTACEAKLIKGNTLSTIRKHQDELPTFDLVYIDGGHSYETVKNDYESIRPCVNSGGVIVFDDFNGQDGVTKFVNELLIHEGGRFDDANEFNRIIISPASFQEDETVHAIFEIA